jgi:hypothetical protein
MVGVGGVGSGRRYWGLAVGAAHSCPKCAGMNGAPGHPTCCTPSIAKARWMGHPPARLLLVRPSAICCLSERPSAPRKVCIKEIGMMDQNRRCDRVVIFRKYSLLLVGFCHADNRV